MAADIKKNINELDGELKKIINHADYKVPHYPASREELVE